jgi:hypothetical protein
MFESILLNLVFKNSANSYAVASCFGRKSEDSESSCLAKHDVLLIILI